MTSRLLSLLGILALLSGCVTTEDTGGPSAAFPPVSIQDSRLWVGGEPFLVVGIGYETGARPGQLPWERTFQPDLLRADFQRIRAAGFNTLRTWSPMTDDELRLAAEYGLWVIQGLWIDPAADFNDPAYQQQTFEFIEREVTRSAPHPNILFYLLLNEPHGDAVFRAGQDHMERFYRQMLQVARRCDPKRFFSYSNCVATDFMKPLSWDLVAQNVYPYSPVTIERALGYRTYLEILREKFVGEKPMLITEFGLSVSPRGDGRGYGGNTLEEQRDGVLRMYDDLLNADCAGACVFMWVDGWHKYGDENTHNDHSEEWYGLLSADSGPVGNPRPVYYALQEYQQAILTTPADGQIFQDQIPATVWAPEMKSVQARLNDGPWQALSRSGRWWWKGTLNSSSLPEGFHRLQTRGINRHGEPVSHKSRTLLISRQNPHPPLGVNVAFINPPKRIPMDEPLKLEVLVTDSQGQPASGRLVQVGRFLHTEWNEYYAEAETDAQGLARVELPPLHRPGIASIAAGTVFQQGIYRKQCGDYIHVELSDSAP